MGRSTPLHLSYSARQGLLLRPRCLQLILHRSGKIRTQHVHTPLRGLTQHSLQQVHQLLALMRGDRRSTGLLGPDSSMWEYTEALPGAGSCVPYPLVCTQ